MAKTENQPNVRIRKMEIRPYTHVDNAALRHSTLSPEAVGVYAVMASWITFQAEDFECSKAFIASKINCGEKKFERIWKELKETGFIKMYCTGKANWEAELLQEPQPDTPHTYYLNNAGEVKRTVSTGDKTEENPNPPQKGGDLENPELNPPHLRGDLESGDLLREGLKQGNNIITPNKNSLNNSFINNQSIYHSESSANDVDNAPKVKVDRLIDGELIEDIKDQIEYDIMKERYDSELLDTAVSCIAALYTASEPQEFSGATYAPEFIHRRSLEITSGHIEYVFECFEQQRDKVYNIPKYLRAAIFNAPDTISAYYTNAVRADGAVW